MTYVVEWTSAGVRSAQWAETLEDATLSAEALLDLWADGERISDVSIVTREEYETRERLP